MEWNGNLQTASEPVRAIFFDVDGTLISYNTHTIPPSALNALEKLRAKGIKLFVATGRHSTEAEILSRYFKFDGFVSLNGQICYDEEGIFYKQSLPKEDVATVVEYVQENELPCHFVRQEYIFTNLINHKVLEMCQLVDVSVPRLESADSALKTDIYQIVAHMDKHQEQQLFARTKGVEATRWHPDFFDIVPKGGSKRVGIEKMLLHCGIPKKYTMAFGDGENDIPMFEAVQTSIAMGNASPVVQARANFVTKGVDEDGIVHALRHFKLV